MGVLSKLRSVINPKVYFGVEPTEPWPRSSNMQEVKSDPPKTFSYEIKQLLYSTDFAIELNDNEIRIVKNRYDGNLKTLELKHALEIISKLISLTTIGSGSNVNLFKYALEDKFLDEIKKFLKDNSLIREENGQSSL